MPRFCANLSLLFRDVPPIDRVDRAAAAGFSAIEFQFPYDIPPEKLQEACRRTGLHLVNMNIPAGKMDRGELGLAALPDREVDFRRSVLQGLAYAGKIGCPRVNVLAGILRDDKELEQALERLARNLQFAAKAAEETGTIVMLEPVNYYDRPGYVVNTLAEAAKVLDRVGHPLLRIQADMYHMARMHETITQELQDHVSRIGHIQFADAPGRNEPGTGELDFTALFGTLDEIGYDGWVSAEYEPSRDTMETLEWLPSDTGS